MIALVLKGLAAIVGFLKRALAPRTIAPTRGIRTKRLLDRDVKLVSKAVGEANDNGRLDRSNAYSLLELSEIYPLCEQADLSRAVLMIARQYGLKFTQLDACFSSNLEDDYASESRHRAGVALISDSWRFGLDADIRVDPEYQGKPRLVAAILAHELGHAFLTLIDDYLGEAPTERQTDIAVYVCGMGKLPLNIIGGTFRLGYLSPEEMAYTYFRTSLDAGISFQWAASDLSRSAVDYLQKYQGHWFPTLQE